MVNLKKLNFAPVVNHPSAPILLQRCTFQLESLVWRGVGSETALYATFLPTQYNLLHLNINSHQHLDRPRLPDRLCPSLLSIACLLSDLSHICAKRPIIGLHVTANSRGDIAEPPCTDLMSAAEREGCLAALEKVKTLRLWSVSQFHRSTSGTVLRMIVALELRVWEAEV